MNEDIMEIYRQWSVIKIRNTAGKMDERFEWYFMKYKETIYNSALSLFQALYSRNLKRSYQNDPVSILALKYFRDFADKNKEIIDEAFWDMRIALQAFEFAIDTESEIWINLICKYYRVDSIPEEESINLVKKALGVKKFSSAAWFAFYAKIIRKIPIEDICGPLICQAKIALVEQLMKNDPVIASSVVQYIDQFVDKSAPLMSLAENVPCANFAMLNIKSISKLAKRLAREYRIPKELCPRTDYNAKMAAVKFLVKRKFIEFKPMDNETWRTMLDTILDPNDAAGDRNIALELIYDLANFEQYEEARRWANLYHIPENEWPESLLLNHTNPDKEYPGSDEGKIIYDWDEEWAGTEAETKAKTNEAEVPEIAITFVDSHEKFKEMNNYIFRRHPLIAIDTEWKPNLGLISEPETKAALIQIACEETIYVIDAIKLRYDSEWKHFVDNIINNPALLKVGFAIPNDIRAIAGLLSHMDVKPDPECFIDYADFHSWLVQFHKIQLPDYPTNSGGLSKLAFAVIGKCLIKTDQYTNWEIRPLTADKITYAATDALVLLQIHEKLEDWCETRGLSYEVLMHGYLDRNPNRVKRFFIREARKEMSNSLLPKTTLKDIKLTVDPGSSSLGTLLRLLGVDVLIPVFCNDLLVESLALRENRHYITGNQADKDVRLPRYPTWTFAVDNMRPIYERLINVCIKFNLIVTDRFIHTRCCRCNYLELKRINKSDFETMKREGKKENNEVEIEYRLIPYDCSSEFFYVCAACGMVYCENSKLHKIVKKWVKSLMLLGFGCSSSHKPTSNPEINRDQARINRFC